MIVLILIADVPLELMLCGTVWFVSFFLCTMLDKIWANVPLSTLYDSSLSSFSSFSFSSLTSSSFFFSCLFYSIFRIDNSGHCSCSWSLNQLHHCRHECICILCLFHLSLVWFVKSILYLLPFYLTVILNLCFIFSSNWRGFLLICYSDYLSFFPIYFSFVYSVFLLNFVPLDLWFICFRFSLNSFFVCCYQIISSFLLLLLPLYLRRSLLFGLLVMHISPISLTLLSLCLSYLGLVLVLVLVLVAITVVVVVMMVLLLLLGSRWI